MYHEEIKYKIYRKIELSAYVIIKLYLHLHHYNSVMYTFLNIANNIKKRINLCAWYTAKHRQFFIINLTVNQYCLLLVGYTNMATHLLLVASLSAAGLAFYVQSSHLDQRFILNSHRS